MGIKNSDNPTDQRRSHPLKTYGIKRQIGQQRNRHTDILNGAGNADNGCTRNGQRVHLRVVTIELMSQSQDDQH